MKSHQIWLNYLSPSLSYGQKNLKGGAKQDRVKVFHLFTIWTETHPQTFPRVLVNRSAQFTTKKNWKYTDPSEIDNL